MATGCKHKMIWTKGMQISIKSSLYAPRSFIFMLRKTYNILQQNQVNPCYLGGLYILKSATLTSFLSHRVHPLCWVFFSVYLPSAWLTQLVCDWPVVYEQGRAERGGGLVNLSLCFSHTLSAMSKEFHSWKKRERSFMKAAQIKCGLGRRKGRKKSRGGGEACTGMMGPAWVKLSGPDLALYRRPTPVGLFLQHHYTDKITTSTRLHSDDCGECIFCVKCAMSHQMFAW